MKTVLAVLALASTAALPAAAAPISTGPAAAIAHFNMDADGQGERISAGQGSATVAASTRANTGLGQVYARFNADQDGSDGLRGLQGATAVSGAPVAAGDIFQRIRLESRETE